MDDTFQADENMNHVANFYCAFCVANGIDRHTLFGFCFSSIITKSICKRYMRRKNDIGQENEVI